MSDRNADWIEWAQNGGLFELDEDSTASQCVSLAPGLDFEYEGNDYTLSWPNNPAKNLLASDGLPVGPAKGTKREGVNYNFWWSRGVASLTMRGYKLDLLSQTGAANSSAGMTSKLDAPGMVELVDTELINLNGGPHNSPDPVHFEAPGIKIKNYTQLRNQIPPDLTQDGVGDGLVGAGGSNLVPDVEIENVKLSMACEVDGILSGGYVKDLVTPQVLVGKSAAAGSWGGHVWDGGVIGPRPAGVGPTLQFSNGFATDWLIDHFQVLGPDPIGNPENFGGTWGKDNVPASLPSSGGGGGAGGEIALGLGVAAVLGTAAYLAHRAAKRAPRPYAGRPVPRVVA
jgi:hypothetical protein